MPEVHYSPIGSVLPSYPYSPADAPADSGAGSGVRAAMLGLFARLGVRRSLRTPTRSTACSRRSPRSRRRSTRATAPSAIARTWPIRRSKAAATGALDVALDVYAAEIRTLRNRARNQAEALKAVRLYAPEAWVRRIAAQALAAPDAPPTLRRSWSRPRTTPEPFTAESQLYG